MITTNIQKGINRAISRLAEKYHSTTQYDDDGHAFKMTYEDCVAHAIDDFLEDIYGEMELEGFECLTDEDGQEICDYAWNDVNTETIRAFA